MEVQEIKEQLKSIFRTVINNDKWITIHPHGEDSEDYRRIKLEDGETPKEAIDRVYKKKDNSESKEVKDKQPDTKDEKKERTFIDKKTGKEQSLKDLVEKGLTPVRYSSSLWENKPSYGIGDGKIEYKITEEEYKQALEHQKDKKNTDLKKAKEQSKDLTDYIKWQYNADIEPHITRRVGDKTLVEWDKLPRETQSALKRLDFDDKVNLEQYSSYEMSIDVKDKKIFENLEKHRQHISEQKQPDTKDGSKDISKEEHAKIKEQVSKMSDDELVKAHFESQKGYESETPRAGSMTKHEATYGEIAQELKRRTGRGFSAASTESEIKEALSKAKSDSKGDKKYNYTLTKKEVGDKKEYGGMADTGTYYTNGDFALDKKYLNIKGQEPLQEPSYKEGMDKVLKSILKGDSTYRYTPVKDYEIGELKREYGKPIKVAKYSYFDEKNGYERNIYINKKYNDLFKNFDLKFGGETEPVFAYKGKDIVGVVMPIDAREQNYSKTVNNEIEEELTEDKNQLKLKIDNSKEQDMALLEEIKKLITKVENNKENEMEIENAKVDKRDIIRQIMAIAGKEEASEDVKTIAKLAEKLAYDKSEAGTADNEMDKEDPDDEKEAKEVKEEVKEDVENKCKNSVDNSKTDYFAEMNKIYNAAQEAKKENIYISQAQREQDAVDYFKK